jgi:hypothetical protein
VKLRKVIMMGISAPPEFVRSDRLYDRWLDTLTEASARLDALQTALTEVRYLCRSKTVDSGQILKVLDWYGV